MYFNRHVIKSGGVDVGTQMIILAINRCLDAVALQNAKSKKFNGWMENIC